LVAAAAPVQLGQGCPTMVDLVQASAGLHGYDESKVRENQVVKP
jgi:hypothetical protein